MRMGSSSRIELRGQLKQDYRLSKDKADQKAKRVRVSFTDSTSF